MIADSDPYRVTDQTGELPVSETPPEKKKPNKPRSLIFIILLAIILVGAAAVFTHPSWLKPRRPPPKPPARPVTPSPVSSSPAPAVQVAWERLDLSSMPPDVETALESGKYFYDRRLPGNFGLAIGYWKQALGRLSGANRDEAQSLLTAAETELARQFHSDSGDAIVFLKQGKRDQALRLLLAMRADFLNITDPQYVWASAMLYRYRR